MTVQELKKDLLHIRVTQLRYRLAVDKARQFDDLICAPKGVGFESHNASSRTNSSEEKVMLAIAYHEKALLLEADMLSARERAEKYISVLTLQSEKEVITRRYLMCQTWEQIADVMNYSCRHVERIHSKALKKMSLNVTQN